MSLETFIITIYCHLCTALEVVVPGGNPRSRHILTHNSFCMFAKLFARALKA